MIDAVLIEQKDLPLFLDKNRTDPTPIVLYDKLNLIQPIDTPHQTYETFQRRIKNVQDQFRFLSRVLVERAIRRGRYVEAVHFYNSRIILPLIEVLRYKYSSSRQDFGLRYLNHNIPGPIAKAIDELHKISSFEDIQKNMDIAEKLFIETVREQEKFK